MQTCFHCMYAAFHSLLMSSKSTNDLQITTKCQSQVCLIFFQINILIQTSEDDTKTRKTSKSRLSFGKKNSRLVVVDWISLRFMWTRKDWLCSSHL